MSKGLEALKRLFIKIKHYDSLDEKVTLENDYSTIEKELKRLEEIDNAMFLNNKKLKALELLKAFDFKFEDYTEELNGSVCVSQRRIILDNDEIDLLKEVLL